MKTSCLIIEPNEKLYSKIRSCLFHQLSHFEGIKHCWNISESVHFLAEHPASLLIVNIELPDGNGFTLLNSVENLDSEILILTPNKPAFVDAIEIAELNYVLLPVNPHKLTKSVDQLIEKVLSKDLPFPRPKVGKIAIPNLTGLDFIDVQNILRCEADNNYTTVFFKNNKKSVVSRSLSQFEMELGQHYFLRVHHKHLINLNMVKSYSKGKGGGFVIMDNDHIIPVSVRKKQNLMESFI